MEGGKMINLAMRALAVRFSYITRHRTVLAL